MGERMEVIVRDIHMGFWSMVVFMIKWSIAAIPAMIILGFIAVALVGLFGGMLGMGAGMEA